MSAVTCWLDTCEGATMTTQSRIYDVEERAVAEFSEYVLDCRE